MLPTTQSLARGESCRQVEFLLASSMISQLSKRMDRDSLVFLPFFFLTFMSLSISFSSLFFPGSFVLLLCLLIHPSPLTPFATFHRQPEHFLHPFIPRTTQKKTRTQVGNETTHRPLGLNNYTPGRTSTAPSASSSSVPSPSLEFQFYRHQWNEPFFSNRRWRRSNTTGRRNPGELCVDVEGDV